MTNDTLSIVDEWGPEKIVVVSDTRTGMQGVLVIDNTARGMGKGGTRMSPTLSVGEIARLARTMTWKWAAVDLLFGGAKAGIRADPRSPDKERIVRAWARTLAKHIPSEYVAGLDMGMSERDAAIIQDELGDRGASVGTPACLGGLPYDELGFTGYGVAECAAEAAEFVGRPLAGATVSIQGFGAVGHAAARRLSELGATIVAISTAAGGIHAPDGLEVERLLELRDRYGDQLIKHYGNGVRELELTRELTIEADVLIPAATQDVINAAVAADIKANIIVEGANLPADEEARNYLWRAGRVLVPDFIANAGAVAVTGVAMDARYASVAPDTDALYDVVATKLRANTRSVLQRASTFGQTPRNAALEMAQDRVREAMIAKGRSEPTLSRTGL